MSQKLIRHLALIYAHKRTISTERNCLTIQVPETLHVQYIVHIYAQNIIMHYWAFQLFSTVSFWTFQSYFGPLKCTKVTGSRLLVPAQRLESTSSLAQLTAVLQAPCHPLMFSCLVFYLLCLSVNWLHTLQNISVCFLHIIQRILSFSYIYILAVIVLCHKISC